MNFKCVIFDLDGTLVNSIEDIAASMNKALSLYDFPVHSPDDYIKMVGWGIKRLAFLALPFEKREKDTADELAKKIAADASRFYAENPLVYSKPYPNVAEVVSAIKQKKVKTAVLTNKPDTIARLVIQGLFPQGSFDMIRGDMPNHPRKPDPATVWDILMELDSTPRETIVVGDSEIDMETAHNANCHALGVSWGYRSRDILEKAKAQRIIDNPEELLQVVMEKQ